jgi:DNA topoisomerase VI subunit B
MDDDGSVAFNIQPAASKLNNLAILVHVSSQGSTLISLVRQRVQQSMCSEVIADACHDVCQTLMNRNTVLFLDRAKEKKYLLENRYLPIISSSVAKIIAQSPHKDFQNRCFTLLRMPQALQSLSDVTNAQIADKILSDFRALLLSPEDGHSSSTY